MNRSNLGLGLLFWVGLCFCAAAIGMVATRTEIGTWYQELNKPSWHPPDSVFGPVWTCLYLMMGIAAWLVWKQPECPAKRQSLILFVVQLALNAGWSWLFFHFHKPDMALVEMTLLWCAIAATVRAFFKSNVTAGWLMVPYWCWVSFATLLNFMICRLN